MVINELERAVLLRFLQDPSLQPKSRTVALDSVAAEDRTYTGVGFLTALPRAEQLRLFDPNVSLRWTNLGARLGPSQTETGYLVYVDEGYITGVEGYTYGGDEWPSECWPMELYEVRPSGR